MEDSKIKCPHCGAQKVEHLGLNQYQCQYCGHTFTVGRENEFSEESRKEFQINKKEERKKEWRKAQLKGLRNVLLMSLAIMGSLLFYFYYENHIADQRHWYWADKIIPNLENGAFSNDNETVEFLDYARKVKINGNVFDCSVYKRENKLSSSSTIVAINSVKYEFCYDVDSTYEFLRHDESKKTWVKRPTRSEKPREIFFFKSEDQLRESLLKAPFKFHEETIRFTDHGYYVVINGNKFEIKKFTIDNSIWNEYLPIDFKARLELVESNSLEICSDENGNNIYIMYHKKKFTR